MKAHRNISPHFDNHPHSLGEAIAVIKTAEEAKSFFDDLCTPTEIQAMVDRWRVVPLIKAGVPYRLIYEQTGVSVTTISRVARCIMLGAGGYNLIYQRLEEENDDKTSKT